MILQEQDSAFKIVARGVDKEEGRNVSERGWQRKFEDPIALPDGRKFGLGSPANFSGSPRF
ncbi:hypothetical protein SAMN05443247_10553 [Bradyrhizobium erythrophlei]|jgi:hypothetical protein|nr:hypothetical protein SAMN05443247_10553 [Bradyrhizobium erythrophlei]